MPLDKESLEALTKALSDGVNERVTNTLEQFSKSQAENLKDGLNGIMTNMLKAQDAFEVKTDLKIDSLGETLSKRQDKSEQENAAKFADISKQLSTLNEAVSQKNPSPALFSHILASQPEPQRLSSAPSVSTSSDQPQANPGDIATIKDIISKARTIIGIGPITAMNLEAAKGACPAEKLNSVAMDYIRNGIGIKEEEIKDEDIIEIFPAEHSDLERAYVQFKHIDQADLCLK